MRSSKVILRSVDIISCKSETRILKRTPVKFLFQNFENFIISNFLKISFIKVVATKKIQKVS